MLSPYKSDIKTGMVEQLLAWFIEHSWGSKVAMKDQTVEICLTYFKDEIIVDVCASCIVINTMYLLNIVQTPGFYNVGHASGKSI